MEKMPDINNIKTPKKTRSHHTRNNAMRDAMQAALVNPKSKKGRLYKQVERAVDNQQRYEARRAEERRKASDQKSTEKT